MDEENEIAIQFAQTIEDASNLFRVPHLCSDCIHEKHPANGCRNCNCGQSLVTHPTGGKKRNLDEIIWS
jgi:ribosomal protein S27E